jgi:hypothetical protein
MSRVARWRRWRLQVSPLSLVHGSDICAKFGARIAASQNPNWLCSIPGFSGALQ